MNASISCLLISQCELSARRTGCRKRPAPQCCPLLFIPHAAIAARGRSISPCAAVGGAITSVFAEDGSLSAGPGFVIVGIGEMLQVTSTANCLRAGFGALFLSVTSGLESPVKRGERRVRFLPIATRLWRGGTRGMKRQEPQRSGVPGHPLGSLLRPIMRRGPTSG